MNKICEILKSIKIAIKNEVSPWIKEHLNYIKYGTEITDEIERIIEAIDKEDFMQADSLIDKYLEMYDNSDMIYHYCSMETFEAILTSKSLWLSDSASMNDKYEGRWIDKIVEEVLERLSEKYTEKELSDYKNKYNMFRHKKAYMCCFSKDGDRLSQWRAYADDASGIAIGFSKEAIRLGHDSDFELTLLDVWYDKIKQINIIEESIKNEYDMKNAKQLAYCFKNPSFNEEEEVRILYQPEVDMQTKIFDDPLESKYYKLMSNNISEMKTRILKKAKLPYFEKNLRIGCLDMGIACKQSDDETQIEYYEYNLEGTLKGFSSKLIPEIVVGPKNRIDTKQIQKLLENSGLTDTKITKSKSSYI